MLWFTGIVHECEFINTHLVLILYHSSSNKASQECFQLWSFFDPLYVLIICTEAVWTAHSFLPLCIDKPFLSSQGKCHDQYCCIGLCYCNNHMKWQERLKGNSMLGLLKGITSMIFKNKHIVITLFLKK